MKILIITFSKGINPGTFLQALGVKTGLLRIFPDAIIEYLDFPDFKQNFIAKAQNDSFRRFVSRKIFATYRLQKYVRLRRKNFKYSKSIDLFDYDKRYANELFNGYDLIVIGSDTILEKANSDDGERIGLNWCPMELCGVKHIFFAASASPANYSNNTELIKKLVQCVNGFSYIGLRDSLTINLFIKKLKVKPDRIIKQPDPTYFLDVTKYRLGNYYQKKLKGRKIALFNFTSDFPFLMELGGILKKKGYFVISTFYCICANLNINTVNPFEWAGIFPLVDIVITERFHDSIFALRSCKPVIAIDWEKDRYDQNGESKTLCILKDYGLSHLHFNIYDKNLVANVSKAIDNVADVFDETRVMLTNKELMSKATNEMDKIKDIVLTYNKVSP